MSSRALEWMNETATGAIREIQSYCADIHEAKREWTYEDAQHIAEILNRSSDAWGLFAFIDEQTGHSLVGYRTRDGREWFHVLRQMRNQVGSGLFENMIGRNGVRGYRF
jgi:hypothetical protein